MNSLYPLVSQRADHRCEYCHAPEAIFNFPFEVEHVTPVSRQGTHDEANLALACRACNLRKGDYVTGLDEETGTEVAIFNPRRDVWTEHLRVDPQNGALIGITLIGRATVSRLQINSVKQQVARQQWMRLGLFP